MQQGLKELGWTDDRTIRIDYRWAAGDANRARAYATELVGMAPDVIFANSPFVLAALQSATHTIPIVFVQVADPIAGGFVASLAHPGGNVTGFTSFEATMSAKWLELLQQTSSRIARLGIIRNSATASASVYLMGAVESAALSSGVRLITNDVGDAAGIEHAFDEFVRESADGLIAMPDPVFSVNRERLVALAALHHLPAVYYYRYFAASGGLMSYGPNTVDLYRRATSYVDRILHGANPGDLPVQQPTKFELVINLNTAKSLGLTMPPTLLARADEVIE